MKETEYYSNGYILFAGIGIAADTQTKFFTIPSSLVPLWVDFEPPKDSSYTGTEVYAVKPAGGGNDAVGQPPLY